MHPLSPLLVPLFGVLVAREMAAFARGRPFGSHVMLRRYADRAGLLLLALLLGVWLARCFGAWDGPVPLE